MKDSTNKLKEIKVLFADDDKGNNRLVEKYLIKLGIQKYKNYFTGNELIEEYKNNSDYDIIILDIRMHEMNGVQTLKELKKISPDIPVIALTAHAMSSDKEKYLKAGFDAYLSKPVSKDMFKQTILSLIG